MKIEELRKQQIYTVIENPNLTKNEKVEEIAMILNKTNEQIMIEYHKKGTKLTLEDIYKTLFSKSEIEREQNEDKKIK